MLNIRFKHWIQTLDSTWSVKSKLVCRAIICKSRDLWTWYIYIIYIYITLSHYISAPVSPVSHCQGGAMAIVPTIINVWSWVPDLIWSDFEEPSWGPAFKSLEIMFGMFVFVIKIYKDNNDNMISEIENWSIVRFLFSFADSRQNLVRKTDFQGFADSMRFLDLFVLRDVHTF